MRSVLPVVVGLVLVGLAAPVTMADDWPQWRGPDRDGVWRETGIIETLPEGEMPLRWRAPVSGGYSGPTVADGRVFVTDRLPEPEERERVLCFDADTGASLWTFAYPCPYTGVGYRVGPRASVTIADGLAYALGTMGHLYCLDAATGTVVWSKTPGEDYDVPPPTWGVSSAPLVEGDLVIAQLGAQPDACVLAWDRRTGEERWRALADPASYAAPVVIDQGGRRVLVCWTGAQLAGLDCATGAQLWGHPTPPQEWVIQIATPVVHEGHVFVSSFYEGARLLRLNDTPPGVELVWHRAGRNERNTEAIHALLCTPLALGEHVYGVDTHGELRCLVLATGERVWENTTAVEPGRWANIHLVRNGDCVWMFNEQGELIIARLTPEGYEEQSRSRLIAPTKGQLERGVCWSHPAFANRHVYARNDEELVCASLAAGEQALPDAP